MNYTNILTSTLDATTVWLYVVEGSILLVFNGIFGMLILTNKKLSCQKEFVLFAINMFFDALFGSAYFVAGIYNLTLYYNEKYFPWKTRLYCFFVPHVQLFVIVTPAVGLISLANSVDRLLSVLVPLKYFQWSRNYSFAIGIAVLICIVPTYVLSFFDSESSKDTLVSGLCLLQYAISSGMYTGMRLVRISSSMFGAFLYIPILMKLKQIVKNSNVYLSDQQKRKLSRTTFTVSLITLNEIVLFTLPDLYVIIWPSPGNLLFFLMNLNKGIVNMVIFIWTQKELRKSIFIFKNRKTGVTTLSNMAKDVQIGIRVPKTR
ncbi:hypothetical protein FO519_008302 [Halicephalobus sp. NKZ332]|nr:hypothetical protein FO519_008302 [Halicephalobus sp. NKZ332]